MKKSAQKKATQTETERKLYAQACGVTEGLDRQLAMIAAGMDDALARTSRLQGELRSFLTDKELSHIEMVSALLEEMRGMNSENIGHARTVVTRIARRLTPRI